MKQLTIRCPCCENKISIEMNDSGEFTRVFFNGEIITDNEAFEQYGICLGAKGGENIE